MTEEDYRFWDTIIKGVVTPIAAVLGILYGLWQYKDGQTKTLEKEYELKKLERAQKREEDKEILYKEARQVVASLASNEAISKQLYATKKERFWELYWGDLASVESPEVERLMVAFGRELTKIEMEKDDAKKENIKESMKGISLGFARQIKTDLE